MSISLTINATAIFDNVEQARAVAQAAEILLASAKHTGGGVTLFDFDTHLAVAVRQPQVDRSKFVQGGQAANEKLTKYTAEFTKRAERPIAAAVWEPLFEHAKQTGEVPHELLTEIVAAEFGLERDAAVGLVAEVIGVVNAAMAEREFRTLMAPKKTR